MSDTKALEELLAKLHSSLAEQFLEEVKSGQAGSATLNAARQFLKDNDITIGDLARKEAEPFNKLAESLIDDDELDQARLN